MLKPTTKTKLNKGTGTQSGKMTIENEYPEIDYRAAANLMAHPVAGFAAFSAIGFGLAGHMMGLVAGTVAGAMEASGKRPANTTDLSYPMSAFLNWTKLPDATFASQGTGTVADETVDPEITTRSAVPETPSIERAIDATASIDAPEPQQPRAMERPEKADDLKRISGIGPKLEQVLNGLGIWTFGQISRWTESEIGWVDDYLQFKGRIDRDGWIAQADAMNTNRDGRS